MTTTCLPSLAGRTSCICSGPVVSCTGEWDTVRPKLVFSASSQRLLALLRVLRKTKYLPLGVHLPQHSAGGLFHSGRSSRRAVPSNRASQREVTEVVTPPRVKRKRIPSGENWNPNGWFVVVTSFRGELPRCPHPK